MVHSILTNPIFAAFIGWLFWNVGKFSLDKDSYDDRHETFPLTRYVYEHVDNWLFSIVAIPVLLYIGYKQLNFGDIGIVEGVSKWSDLYYLSSGFIAEAGKDRYKKWRKKQTTDSN